MKKRKLDLSFLLILLSLFLIGFSVSKTIATKTIHEIYDFNDLVTFAKLSRTDAHNADNYVLKNDIIITTEEQASLAQSDFKYISFGSRDNPFKGEFDGNGYTIKNLKYDSTLSVATDTGLFSYTSEGAVIKNLVIDNADIDADFRGGIVVGYASHTLIENVIVKNSHINVASADNVITLITDGGIRGGALVGDLFDSTIYNCEARNTFVNTNNTSGVAALAGKGLSLGGLVGISNNSLIEYSRVVGGTVKNYYDVAVGAIGGNTLYVGGIIGQMQNGSQVIDSFSTATLNYYCATYVSVAAGNSGHIGGITAKMSGDKNEIHRSHYAGTASSKQYNAVLVIPIIQSNKNISGIADVFEGGVIDNVYFKPSLSQDVDMNVLGSSSSTSSYKPLNDDVYSDRNFFEDANYDFSNSIKRSTSYSDDHYNKWVMDYNLGIPVHGKSISATFDFDKAGKIEIMQSELSKGSVSTDNPYLFAVQGLLQSELNTKIKAISNDGYRFAKWYKLSDMKSWHLDENYEFFDDIFNNNESISNDSELSTTINDDDFFIAKYEANVIYYDINNNEISNDWYSYNDKLPNIKPTVNPASENAALIGWTTQVGDYSSTTSSELDYLKSINAFYKSGDKITKTLKLYPVYSDLITNVKTVCEGHTKDSIDNPSIREGVAITKAIIDNNNVKLSITGYNEEEIPDGYLFIGWYDENGIRLSTDKNYSISIEDIDLTKEHTFTAKFLYKIEYYEKRVFNSDNGLYKDGKLFAERYQRYDTEFDNIKGLDFYREIFDHWGPGDYQNAEIYNENITGYTKVYSSNVRDTGSDSSTNYTTDLSTDFPGASYVSQGNDTSHLTVSNTYDENLYNLVSWSFEAVGSHGSGTYYTPIEGTEKVHNFTDILPSVTYTYMSHLTANMFFHQKDGSVDVVTRRYKENILLNDDNTYTYKYVIRTSNNTSYSTTSKKTPEANKINNYYFIGWIDKKQLTKEELSDLYDTSEEYVTTSISKAKKYIINKDSIVYESMDLYPVYAKFNVKTLTNITFDNINVNKPKNPDYEIIDNKDGTAKVVFSMDLNTTISNTDDRLFELNSFERIIKNGTEKIEKNDEVYSYVITAGPTYTFRANYVPYLILYHVNSADIKYEIRNDGDIIGEMPEPNYNLDNIDDDGDIRYTFLGYSDLNELKKYDTYEDFKNSNTRIYNKNYLVKNSLELYPVYVGLNINVKSNIDSYLTNKGISTDSIRKFIRPDNSRVVIKASSVDGYEFEGWYKNYVDDSNKGTLITNTSEYELDDDNKYSNNTFTAVYKKVYKLRYFGKNNNVLYETTVSEDDDRTFVVNGLDSSNNEILSPYDSEAFINIYNSLNKDEIFMSYNYVSDGNIYDWNSFYNQKITKDMDLYPEIRKVEVMDHNKLLMDIDGGDVIITGDNSNKLSILLNKTYDDFNMYVNVKDYKYKINSYEISSTYDITIDAYPHNNKEENILDSSKTDNQGECKLSFYGNILLSPSSDIIDDVYLFDLLDNSGSIKKNISIKRNEVKIIKVPFGKYNLSLDNKWSWRYTVLVNGNGYINNDNLIGAYTFSNNTKNNRWFDKSIIKNNDY